MLYNIRSMAIILVTALAQAFGQRCSSLPSVALIVITAPHLALLYYCKSLPRVAVGSPFLHKFYITFTHCKCKNVIFGLLRQYLFPNKLWYNCVGFIFINE
jgi:hypothetical protein